MTIEHSQDTAHAEVTDEAKQAVAEPLSEARESGRLDEGLVTVISVPNPSLPDVVQLPSVHDSAPPVSRKLAPPPKPKRDSGITSRPPSARAALDTAEMLSSSNALKAPLTPSIGAELRAAAARAASSDPAPSNAVLGLTEARAGAESAFAAPGQPSTASSSAPRAVASPPRPRSEPLQLRPRSEPVPPSAPVPSAEQGSKRPAAPSQPPSSSAIFAMRIIAVGDSVRPPRAQDAAADLAPDAYPPSASRLGTGTRRSSRPAPKASGAPEPALIPARAPVPASGPSLPASAERPVDLTPAIEVDVLIDIELPVSPTSTSPPAAAAQVGSTPFAGMLPPPFSSAQSAEVAVDPPPAELRAPPPPAELAEELVDADLAPDSVETSGAPTDLEELGGDDAISMPPEEVAALQTELQAKAEAQKPPPPPKRGTVLPPSAPPAVDPGASPRALPVAAEASAQTTPPTPDLAAAKAAQRSKTRLPWWEDLFSEDFMRASARVSDEQIRREVNFIEESLGVADGGVVLDLGCGGGHHAVEFASRGYGVVGYDLSLYQLALAADVAQERKQKINFLQGDMREMAFEEMFDGVFCWNTSFGYFEEDKNLAVAQRVFRALRPGGMFLVDVLNRDFAAASAPCTVWYEGDACVCMDDMSVDYISSRLRVKRSIILDDGRTKESLFSLRLYSLHELGKLLHEVGFRVTEASGHPATPGVFFGPNSPRIIMLAQRP